MIHYRSVSIATMNERPCLDRESTQMSNVKYRNVIPTTKSTVAVGEGKERVYDHAILSRYASCRRKQAQKGKCSPPSTIWTTKFVVPFFSRHVVFDVVEGLAKVLHPQRANATSTPAFFPPRRRLVENPTAKPEPKPKPWDHRLVL